MLKTLGSTKSKTQSGEGKVGIGDSKVRRDDSKLDGSRINDGKLDGGEFGNDEVGKKVQKLSKSKNLSKKTVGSDFFIPGARLAFIELRQAFIKAPIFYHFDSKCHIRIETDAFGYAIGGVFSQLTLDDSGQWLLVAFSSQKMIPAEIKYETYNGELLAIIEAFKTWRNYLKKSQYEVLVLTDYNNLRQFMDIKSLSSR